MRKTPQVHIFWKRMRLDGGRREGNGGCNNNDTDDEG
jgi:hypothetical protein